MWTCGRTCPSARSAFVAQLFTDTQCSQESSQRSGVRPVADQDGRSWRERRRFRPPFCGTSLEGPAKTLETLELGKPPSSERPSTSQRGCVAQIARSARQIQKFQASIASVICSIIHHPSLVRGNGDDSRGTARDRVCQGSQLAARSQHVQGARQGTSTSRITGEGQQGQNLNSRTLTGVAIVVYLEPAGQQPGTVIYSNGTWLACPVAGLLARSLFGRRRRGTKTKTKTRPADPGQIWWIGVESRNGKRKEEKAKSIERYDMLQNG
ncbi:hypothetical protein G7046_g23 [Stylonectria norvegica]|nr:hypothetical protein G7046_g23 [Stylonectria norvegica]